MTQVLHFLESSLLKEDRSIERFSQALENENKFDKTVDFITCLESLFSSKEQQLSFRFAMRVAIVLGLNPHQKSTLQEFILQIYDLRSKIVHGDELPEIKIGGNVLEHEDCNKILEKIARNSIKIFLELISTFNTKEELHKMIDISVYDAIKGKTFSQISKKLKLPEIIIIRK